MPLLTSSTLRSVLFSVLGAALLCCLLFVLDLDIREAWSTIQDEKAPGPEWLATTGRVFAGAKVRSFDHRKLRFSAVSASRKSSADSPLLGYLKGHAWFKHAKCKFWAVTTTIYEPSPAVLAMSTLAGWCVVVIADKRGPKQYPLLSKEREASAHVYIDVTMQQEMAERSAFVAALPWNHIGRKAIGYLVAILHGAVAVWDFDDDNVLMAGREPGPLPPLASGGPANKLEVKELCKFGRPVLNPYPLFGPPASPCWPRGFPLNAITDRNTSNASCLQARKGNITDVGIIQSLADGDPDVDAIYRLTQPLPWKFEAKKDAFKDGPAVLLLPPGVLAPFNAQAATFYRPAMFGMLLPTTVHGRVSDIWRAYSLQPVLWACGLKLGFTRPLVTQVRHHHDPLADMDAEDELYRRTTALTALLAGWSSDLATPEGRLEQIWVELYERDYIQMKDVQLLQLWLAELSRGGYKFPEVARHR